MFQMEEMYSKAHTAIREDPEHKGPSKEMTKGKRSVSPWTAAGGILAQILSPAPEKIPLVVYVLMSCAMFAWKSQRRLQIEGLL